MEQNVQVWPITRADCVYHTSGNELLSTVVDKIAEDLLAEIKRAKEIENSKANKDHTHDNYLSTNGGVLNGYIAFSTNAVGANESQPTQLAYGLLSSYGQLRILGNTDALTGEDECVHIASGAGLYPEGNKGIAVYRDYAMCFGSKILTEEHTAEESEITEMIANIYSKGKNN